MVCRRCRLTPRCDSLPGVPDPYATVRRLLRTPARSNYHASLGLQSPLLLEWLTGRYGSSQLLRWRGGQYPAAVTSSSSLPLVQPGGDDPFLCERLLSRLYLRWGGATHNGTVLRLLRADSRGLTVSRCGFFDMLDTCYSLEWELLASIGEWCSGGRRAPWRDLESKLLLRRYAEDRASDPFREGYGRAAGVGVCLVVRRRMGGGWRFLAARRAPSRIAIRSAKLHVVPAGMLTPGRPVRQTAIRELLEEVLGIEENGRGISNEPEYRRLRRSNASFAVTGLAMNMISLCGDVCATLTIDDPRWWSREPLWRLNHEHAGGLVSIEGAPPWWDIVPQAAGAFALAEATA
jgi:hypothetical protein